MKPEWKEFMQNAGAVIEDDHVTNFGNSVRELRVTTTGNIMADLSHYGLIAVHGRDAETFLQGQFTNDIRQVDTQHSQLSGYCSPKGRLLALFRIFKRGDSYYLMPMSGGGSPGESPKLNGKQIGAESMVLGDGDVIEVAGTQLKFTTDG